MSREVNVMNTSENNRLISQMPNIRIFYSKKGRAKYISHLDITRCMQRSLKRAGLPVWYTQGFNPHMYMTFALPLPLGYDSECEVMDLRLTQKMDFSEIKDRLNQSLPPDIVVKQVAEQKQKPQLISKADYEISFLCQEPAVLAEQFDAFTTKDEILVMKRTKKGEKQIDIKPDFVIVSKTMEPDRAVYLLRVSAGQKNINPTLLTDLFLSQQNLTDAIRVQVVRKQIYLEDGSIFE